MSPIASIRQHGFLLGTLFVLFLIMVGLNYGTYALLGNPDTRGKLQRIALGVDIEASLRGVPVYPGSLQQSVSARPLRFAAVYQGVWQSDDPVPDVARWYERTLRDAGWVPSILPADGSDTSLRYYVFERSWNRRLALSLTTEGDPPRTVITVDLGPKYQDDEVHMMQMQ